MQIVSALFNKLIPSVVACSAFTVAGTAKSIITFALSDFFIHLSWPSIETTLPSASIKDFILSINPLPRLTIDSEVASWFITPILTGAVAFAILSLSKG